MTLRGDKNSRKKDPKLSFAFHAERFNKILHRVNAISLVDLAIKQIRVIEDKQSTEWGGWVVWEILFIIRRAFEHGRITHPHRAKPGDLVKLANLVKKLGSRHHFLEGTSDAASIHKFLRTLAFQQFWWQRRLSRGDLSRVTILFGSIPPENPIARRFLSLTGIPIPIFLLVAFFIWNWFYENPNNISIPLAVLERAGLRWEHVRAFIHATALSPPDVCRYFREQRKGLKNPFLHLFEQSPFIRYPFLQAQRECVLYGRRILDETIRSYIPRRLREDDPHSFGEAFSPVFESYPKLGLNHLGCAYYLEDDLRGHISGKLVDYLVLFPDGCVCLEVKAIELSALARANPTTDILINELQSSVIKAVVQSLSVQQSIRMNPPDLAIPNASSFWTLVVTHGDLYLWSGGSAWEEFLRDGVSEELADLQIPLESVDPGRIFVVSVETFDHLIYACAATRQTMSQVFAQVYDENAKPAGFRFDFSQHVVTLAEPGDLPYLSEGFDRFVSSNLPSLQADR